MNIFVLLQLLPSFFWHAIIVGFIVFILLWLVEFTDFISTPVSIAIGILLLLLVILIPHGWEYIFSSETDIAFAKMNIKSLVQSPTIYQYLITDITAVMLGAVGGYILFFVKFIANKWR